MIILSIKSFLRGSVEFDCILLEKVFSSINRSSERYTVENYWGR